MCSLRRKGKWLRSTRRNGVEADGKADGTDLTEERNILVMRLFQFSA